MSRTGVCGSVFLLLLKQQADLKTQAREFASDLSVLLNGTITHGIRISAGMTPAGVALVGYGVTPKNLVSSSIKLRTRQAQTSLYLYVAYTLDLDKQNGRFLTVTKSTYGLGRGEAESDIRYDYVRSPSNDYPEVHLHIHGGSEALAGLASAGWGVRSSSRLHLPVGGRRFRPCLEDIIEFCIVEKMVEPQQQDWKEVLDTHRDEFYRKQLKSAVRRDPQAAVSALEQEGFRVSRPNDG